MLPGNHDLEEKDKHEALPFFANTSEKSKGYNVHSHKWLFEEIKVHLTDRFNITREHLGSF